MNFHVEMCALHIMIVLEISAVNVSNYYSLLDERKYD